MPLFDAPKRVGFTGTQIGMTQSQRKELEEKLKALKAEGYVWFHHGNCIGADEQAAMIAKRLGFRLHAHPCNIKKKQSNIWNDITENEKLPLTRNKDIVDRCTVMFAAPKSREEELRSGTWATVRHARKVERDLRLLLP